PAVLDEQAPVVGVNVPNAEDAARDLVIPVLAACDRPRRRRIGLVPVERDGRLDVADVPDVADALVADARLDGVLAPGLLEPLPGRVDIEAVLLVGDRPAR